MPNEDLPMPPTPFIDRLRAGDGDAWALFYQKYEQRIRAYIAKRIAVSGWRSRADDEDIWMSLLGSLVRRLRPGGEELDIEKMTAFVAGMARHKWLAKNAEQHALRRSPKREVADGAVADEAEHPGAMPSQVAIAREEYERFMASLDPLDRQILDLDLQGYSTKEIAEKVNRSQRTVQLRLEKIDFLLAGGPDVV
jgi:RNA polymerase sigma factor (sigma-70 family)